MYFIPRNNQFYSFIAHLRPFYRYMLTLFIISFIFILWAIGIYFPLGAHIDHSFTKLTKLRTQCQQINKAKRNCVELERSLQTLYRDAESDKPEKTTQNPLQSNLLFILDQAKNTGLVLNHYIMDKKTDDQWTKKNSAHFTFTGNLKQIIDFLKQLKKTDCLLGYDHFSLKNVGSNSFRMTITLNIISLKQIKNPFNLEQAEGLGG